MTGIFSATQAQVLVDSSAHCGHHKWSYKHLMTWGTKPAASPSTNPEYIRVSRQTRKRPRRPGTCSLTGLIPLPKNAVSYDLFSTQSREMEWMAGKRRDLAPTMRPFTRAYWWGTHGCQINDLPLQWGREM